MIRPDNREIVTWLLMFLQLCHTLLFTLHISLPYSMNTNLAQLGNEGLKVSRWPSVLLLAWRCDTGIPKA
jgi:hypothetical protein